MGKARVIIYGKRETQFCITKKLIKPVLWSQIPYDIGRIHEIMNKAYIAIN